MAIHRSSRREHHQSTDVECPTQYKPGLRTGVALQPPISRLASVWLRQACNSSSLPLTLWYPKFVSIPERAEATTLNLFINIWPQNRKACVWVGHKV